MSATGTRQGVTDFWRHYAKEPEDREVTALRERVEVLERIVSQLVEWAHQHDPGIERRVNGWEKLLDHLGRPDLAGAGVTREVLDLIAEHYEPPSPNGAAPEDAELDESWLRVDLRPALAGETVVVTPEVFRRDDGARLFYLGRVNGVHGDSGDGKSMVVTAAAAQELNDGSHVCWIDFEDNEHVIIERLRMFGVTDAKIRERLHYHRPTSPFDDEAVAAVYTQVFTVVSDGLPTITTMLVIDSLGEAFGLEGIDEDRDVQVGPWLRRVARTLADAGVAVVIIDHSTKAKDNPLFPSGSKRKRAAITGASYLVTATVPLTREHGGRLALTVAKDRHGNYKRGERVATFDLAFYPDGGASVKLWPPNAADTTTSTPDEKLRVVARAAIRAAKNADHPLSQRELERLMNVTAGHETKRAGIDYATGTGALHTEAGPGRTILHTYNHDLDDPAP